MCLYTRHQSVYPVYFREWGHGCKLYGIMTYLGYEKHPINDSFHFSKVYYNFLKNKDDNTAHSQIHGPLFGEAPLWRRACVYRMIRWVKSATCFTWQQKASNCSSRDSAHELSLFIIVHNLLGYLVVNLLKIDGHINLHTMVLFQCALYRKLSRMR